MMTMSVLYTMLVLVVKKWVKYNINIKNSVMDVKSSSIYIQSY